MACKRMFYREIRRQKAADSTKSKRAALKEVADNRGWKYSTEQVREAQMKLRQLSRDTSPCRQRNRCYVCGRPRGYVSTFGLCRIHLRELALQGLLPGIRFSSW